MKLRTSSITGLAVASVVVFTIGATVVGHEGNSSANVIHACGITDGQGGNMGLIGEVNLAPRDAAFKCPTGAVVLHWNKQGPKGDTGVAGPKGDKGAVGVAGPQGDTGLRGVKGDAGPTGATGDRGPNGTVGPQGDTGPRGDAGAKGDPGDRGPQGDTGAQGDRGAAGDPGAKGDTGDRGPQGDTGVQGDRGAQGATGPQGVKGDAGNTGSQGPKGDTGATGATGPAQTATYVKLTNSSNDDTITVDCGTGKHAIAGGGQGIGSTATGGNHLGSSYPSNSSGTALSNNATNSQYWTVTFGGTSASHVGWAVCVAN